MLALATQLADEDRHALRTLIARRRIGAATEIHDVLDLALALVKAESVQHALQHLHREQLHALHDAAHGGSITAAEAVELRSLALLIQHSDGSLSSLPEVNAQLAQLDTAQWQLPAPTPAPSDDTQHSSGEHEDHRWFAQAITAVRISSELLRQLPGTPIPLTKNAHPTTAALKRIAERLRSNPETVDLLITVLHHAGLITTSTMQGERPRLVLGETANSWLQQSVAARWLGLAMSATERIDQMLTAQLKRYAGSLTRSVQELSFDYPLLPAAKRLAAQRTAQITELLGLTVSGALTPPAHAFLLGDHANAQTLAEAALAETTEGVYLQPDLSVIVPGVLPASDEALLSLLSDIEHLGAAASLRITPASLHRAHARGITPAEMHSFLSRISRTGVPQVLEFFINDLPQNQVAHSRHSQASHPHSHSPATGTAGSRHGDPRHELEAMLDRLCATHTADTAEAELLRRLRLALREQQEVRITASAHGTTQSFTLVPISVNNGRIRASDPRAGVERTLPIAAIQNVEAL